MQNSHIHHSTPILELNADLRNKREEEGEFAVGDRSAAEHYHDEVDDAEAAEHYHDEVDAEAAEEDLGVRKACCECD